MALVNHRARVERPVEGEGEAQFVHPTVDQWLDLPKADLDRIFRAASTGPIPTGDTAGTAILLRGSLLSRPLSRFIRALVWRGKMFRLTQSPDRGELLNKMTPWSRRWFRAQVYPDKSWLDGKPAIAIDYSRSNPLVRMIHDEIREAQPGVYLGKAWVWKWQVLDFALVAS